MKGWLRGPKAAVLIGLALFAVGVQNYIFFSSQPPPVTAIADDDEPSRSAIVLDGDAPLEIVNEAEVVAWLGTLPAAERNPFLLGSESDSTEEVAGPLGLPELTGTLVGTHRSVAWFEGWPYAEGDRVGELTLLRVFPQAVLMKRGDEEIRLALRRNPNLDGGELE